MSTYSTAGVGYGEPAGTYGDLEFGDVPAEAVAVPTPTYATGATARTSVSGPTGRSTVSGPVGSNLATEVLVG